MECLYCLISCGNERKLNTETNVRCRFAKGKILFIFVHHMEVFVSTPRVKSGDFFECKTGNVLGFISALSVIEILG